jgi:ribose transport system permease protein
MKRYSAVLMPFVGLTFVWLLFVGLIKYNDASSELTMSHKKEVRKLERAFEAEHEREAADGELTLPAKPGLLEKLSRAITTMPGNTLKAFVSLDNNKKILTQTVIIAIGALGMTFVIISAGIDLSVGSLIAFSSVVLASAINLGATGDAGTATWAVGFGWICVSVLIMIAASGAVGFANGYVSTRFNIVPFIVTLGMMQVVRGLALLVADKSANSSSVTNPPNVLLGLMEQDSIAGISIGFNIGVWVMLILMVVTAYVLKYTVFGRYVYAIGSNEQTARLCGINVSFHKILIYVICGVYTAIAGIMQYSYIDSGRATEALGKELDIIAAVVIGGGSLNGGEGSATGAVIGAIMMTVLRNGCVMLGAPDYVQRIVIGAIIVIAVWVDQLKHRKSA